jgi:WD40-like Beta Propeller Repeat
MAPVRRFVYGLIAAVAFFGTTSAHAAFPGANGKIAFTRGGQIYAIQPDGTGSQPIVSSSADFARWSPDGKQIAYDDRNQHIWVANADGTQAHAIFDYSGDADFAEGLSWSPDGTKLVVSLASICADCLNYPAQLWTVGADGSNPTNIFGSFPGPENRYPAWSPDGQRIAFSSDRNGPAGSRDEIFTIKPDGTGLTQLTTNASGYDVEPSWSPDGRKLAYSSNDQIYSLDVATGLKTRLTNDPYLDFTPAWSPDGAKLALARNCSPSPCPSGLFTMNADGSGVTQLTSSSADTDPDWQPVPYTGYPRPRGASPLLVALVVAYRQCVAPNETHGGGIAAPSCSQPAQASSYLTVGTPDSNGLPAGAIGSVRYTTIVGDPSTAQNEADLRIQFSLTDVLRKSTLVPYSGELQADQTVRITDKNNAGGTGGTVIDTSFPVTVPCGSGTCTTTTTANTIVPGSVVEGQRANWELGGVKVYDGGLDGLAATTADNTLFMDEGFFVP